MFNAEKVKNECVQWIRDFFEQNGKGCNAVVGISGGKDSSIVAALCVEALGRDKVIGVLMPNGEQSDIDKAKLLVDTLGIKHYILAPVAVVVVEFLAQRNMVLTVHSLDSDGIRARFLPCLSSSQHFDIIHKNTFIKITIIE